MNNNFDAFDANKETSKNKTYGKRAALCDGLLALIREQAEELTDLGFSPEMARFDCLITVKIIVDELYDEFNVGHARQEWYREYVRFGFKNPSDSG